MKKAIPLILLAAALCSGCASSQSPALAHTVFFTLNDNAPAQTDALVSDCYKYLRSHSGVVSFYAGTLAPEMDRPVNVKDFDVSLHMVFQNAAAHDRYQASPKHAEFIDRNKANWTQVRVFDSSIYNTIDGPCDHTPPLRHPHLRMGFGVYGH